MFGSWTPLVRLNLRSVSFPAIFHNFGFIVVALLPEVFLYSHTSRCIFVICVLAFFFHGTHCQGMFRNLDFIELSYFNEVVLMPVSCIHAHIGIFL